MRGGSGDSCAQVATTTVIQAAVSLNGFVDAMKSRDVQLADVQLQQVLTFVVSGLDGELSDYSSDAACVSCAVKHFQIRAAAAALAGVPVAAVRIVGLNRRRLHDSLISPTQGFAASLHRRLQRSLTIEVTCSADVSDVPAFASADATRSAFVTAAAEVSAAEIAAGTGASEEEARTAMLSESDLSAVTATEPEYETTILCSVHTDRRDDFASPHFLAGALVAAGTPVSTDMVQALAPLCAPALGLQHHSETQVTAADGLANPRDLEFDPAHPHMLWIANNDTDALTIVDTTGGAMSAMGLQDRAPFHYMERISSLAFEPGGYFATCQESRNSYNDLMVPNNFMGPTLYGTTTAGGASSSMVTSRAQPCDPANPATTCFLTHYDMLHETPMCMGIAHD